MAVFQFYLQPGKERKAAGGQVTWEEWIGDDRQLCLVKNSLVKKEVWDSALSYCSGQSLRTFSCSCCKSHSSMQNWQFGLPGRILCEQSPWCQRKLWACFWLCSSVSVSLDFPCMAHAFFPEHLSNHCTFSKICTNFYAVPLSDTSWNCIRTDIQLQINGHKKS
jgi:hypothetical protein